MKNYYQILSLENFAKLEDVKKSYRKMVKKFHPDINKDIDPQIMVEINLAYEVLGDINKKIKYDAELKSYLNSIYEKKDKFNFCNNKNSDHTRRGSYTYGSQSRRKSTLFEKIFVKFNKIIIDSFQDKNFEFAKMYNKGCRLDNHKLVYMFLYSEGIEQQAYAKVLYERELLKVDEFGYYIPTNEFIKLRKEI